MTGDLEVRQCRVLLAVEEKGGIAAAARFLGVAQSTVSETLLSLERLLGVPVTVRRRGQGASLTAEAASLIPYARQLVSASEAAMAAVTQTVRITVRLGTVESISSFLLPEPLLAIRQRWPDVDVRVAIGLCEDLKERVSRADLDAALTIEGSREGDAARAQLCFVVSPHHPLSEKVVSRQTLQTHTLLLTDHAGAFSALLESWLVQPRLESAGSIDGVKRGVFNSEAIGVLPDYAVIDEVRTRSLVALRLKDLPPPISLRLTTRTAPRAGSPLETLVGQIVRGMPAVA